jgi:hypothetical protein
MEITVHVIPHNEQRYETSGDWLFNPDNNRLTIWVSELGDWRYNSLVAVHEIVEALLCRERDIPEAKIAAFDRAFEKNRTRGNTDEPGDSPKAPYRKEHFFATNIERLFAAELKVDWAKYEEAFEKL